jgi:hypothetical protein
MEARFKVFVDYEKEVSYNVNRGIKLTFPSDCSGTAHRL